MKLSASKRLAKFYSDKQNPPSHESIMATVFSSEHKRLAFKDGQGRWVDKKPQGLRAFEVLENGVVNEIADH